jgi:formamidopyrimidine-DNA glycosylase
MPELPEIETIKNGIKNFKSQYIKKIIIRNYSLRYPVDKNIPELCQSQTVNQIIRRGKYLILILSKHHLIIHLGMSGKINILKNTDTKSLEKHDHFDIIGEDYTIRYNDARRFGSLILCDNYLEHNLIKNLGPEPLSEEFSSKYLMNVLKNKKSTIKQLIMDNKIVVGVGNIYASESLFIAKISPLKIGNNITILESERLVITIKNVLKEAIKLGGSTLRDYKQADGSLGYFQNQHKVYGKLDMICSNCNKTEIKSIRLGQRNTFYCPNCQK